LPVYCETLHHYACFSFEEYRQPRGFCYHTYPSLKGPEDNKALWQGLLNDAVSTTATDEFPTTLDHKLLGTRIDNVTGGNLGRRGADGIAFTEGVVRRGMTLPRFVDVTRRMRPGFLGCIRASCGWRDADIVLIDPSIKRR
jgi:dihydropyrimidinase